MTSNKEVWWAEWTLKQTCKESKFCFNCPHKDNCNIGNKECDWFPNEWNIPEPPPEPTERQRIEWLRMLPDNDLIDAQSRSACDECVYTHKECMESKKCATGNHRWWHEVVSLEQFRKDVGLSNDTDS